MNHLNKIFIFKSNLSPYFFALVFALMGILNTKTYGLEFKKLTTIDINSQIIEDPSHLKPVSQAELTHFSNTQGFANNIFKAGRNVAYNMDQNVSWEKHLNDKNYSRTVNYLDNFDQPAYRPRTSSLNKKISSRISSSQTTSASDFQSTSEPAQHLEDRPNHKWAFVKIKKGDSLSKMFNQLGLTIKEAIDLATADDTRQLNNLTVGKELQIKIDAPNQFAALKYQIDQLKTLSVSKDKSGGYVYFLDELEPIVRIRDVSGPIQSTLDNTAKALNIQNRTMNKLSNIFRWDIDFSRDIRDGDSFSIIYEEKYINNELIDIGDIVAAEFIINGNIKRAIRHQDKQGNIDYYTPEGKSRKKAFLRSPLRTFRITSTFSKRRFNPALKKWRAHKGVDYAAPRGTPIMASASGTIRHIGRKGAYGNAIVLDHGESYTTLYGHMKSFKNGLSNKTKVKQGQIIGYVGSTGLATGPHLHYEIQINGRHVNPLTVDLPQSLFIDSGELREFMAESRKWVNRLDSMHSQTVASINKSSVASINKSSRSSG